MPPRANTSAGAVLTGAAGAAGTAAVQLEKKLEGAAILAASKAAHAAEHMAESAATAIQASFKGFSMRKSLVKGAGSQASSR